MFFRRRKNIHSRLTPSRRQEGVPQHPGLYLFILRADYTAYQTLFLNPRSLERYS